MKRTVMLLIGAVMLCFAVLPLTAQQKVIRYEGGKKKVILRNDSLQVNDSLHRDSTMKDSILTNGSKLKVDSAHLKSTKLPVLPAKVPTTEPRHRWSLTKDTIPAGKLTMLSLIPGVGQIYNRQYWKVPVFYGAIGGFLAGGIITSNTYQKYKDDWQRTIDLNMPQEIKDRAQAKMEQAGTTRTILYSMAAATYLYQVADATFNYRGKVDHVRKATTLAAIFPGAGFVYTKTYWRLPIYYGGFIVIGTVIDYNNRSYQRYANAYNALTDGDPTTIDEFNGRYTPEMLQNARNNYRRNRDLGIIFMAAAYILSIVDTHVIASLKNWDVSPDLSVTVEPTVINNSMQGVTSVPSGAGLSLKLRF